VESLLKFAKLFLFFCAGLGAFAQAHADCIHEAALHHGVNPHVLRAIGWHESRLRPHAIGHNQNGTVDIGAFQINSMHLGKLSKYGVNASSLKNGCVSAYVAAWHYKKQVYEYGNTWRAVGAYHSRTPARSAWYANAIAKVLIQWHVLPSGALPYARSKTLAPGQSRFSSSATLVSRQATNAGRPAALILQGCVANPRDTYGYYCGLRLALQNHRAQAHRHWWLDATLEFQG
jgi:lysozyme-related protein Hpa2